MTNTVRIDIEVNDNASQASTAGKRISAPMEKAATDIDRAFDKTSKQLATSLDRIEKEAWESGKGTGQAFDTAMSGLRKSLELAREEAAQTGKGLRSSLGDSLGEVRKGAEKLAESLKPVAQATVPIDRNWQKTVRLFEADLDRIERDAWNSGRGMDRAFTTAFASMRNDFERVRDVGRRTGASLESDLGQSLRDVKKEMDRLGAEAKDTGKEIEQALSQAGEQGGEGLSGSLSEAFSGGGFDVGGMIESLTGGSGAGPWAAAGAAIGGSIAAAEWEAFQSYWSQQELGGVIAAQQGASVAQAGKFGRVAGGAYYAGFADSVEEGGEALSGVLGQGLVDTTDSQAEIQELTNMAATASKVVGDDANSIARAASQLIKTGLAGNAEEAIDLIVRASQAGANAAGDLIDTVEEYSTQFRSMGLSGQESMGLIQQALKGGARDADVAADAIKEFHDKATDGSATTARGFRTLGLDANDMAGKIAAGGQTAHDGLQQVLNGLMAIEDPMKRNQTASDLFGDKAIDLGDALYSMDLDTAADQMGGFAGATDSAAKAMQSTQSPLDKFSRGFEQAMNAAVGGIGALEQLAGGADQVEKKFDGSGKHVADFGNAVEGSTGATDGAAASASEYARSLGEVISAMEQLATDYADSERASIDYQAAIDAAHQSLVDNGKTIDENTEKGRNNREALLDLSDKIWQNIGAMENQGKTATDVKGFIEGARAQFVQMAIDMGYGTTEANQLADGLHLIPGDYNARIHADATQALGALAAVRNSIASIPRNINIALQQTLHAVTGKASGGVVGVGNIWGAASGGQRHSSTMIDEAGPEVAELPNGTRMLTAGATRAMVDAGAFGSGGATQVVLSMDSSDPLIRAIMGSIRAEVKNYYGGDVTQAFNQRGVGAA